MNSYTPFFLSFKVKEARFWSITLANFGLKPIIWINDLIISIVITYITCQQNRVYVYFIGDVKAVEYLLWTSNPNFFGKIS